MKQSFRTALERRMCSLPIFSDIPIDWGGYENSSTHAHWRMVTFTNGTFGKNVLMIRICLWILDMY